MNSPQSNVEADYIEIPLTQGQVALVSPEDADLLQFKWCALFDPSYGSDGAYKAARSVPRGNKKRTTQYAHRLIMSRILGRDLLRSEIVDHRDLNPLNNRRDNLRIATPSQSCMNRSKQGNATGMYKGITFYKPGGKWRSEVRANGVRYYLGQFDTPEEAHEAYCKAARELHGEFANLGKTA